MYLSSLIEVLQEKLDELGDVRAAVHTEDSRLDILGVYHSLLGKSGETIVNILPDYKHGND